MNYMTANTYVVYIHTCLAEGSSYGKVYVGITYRKPQKRWGVRGNNYEHCKYFDNAIKKYGWDKFSHEIVASGLTREEAFEKEHEFVVRYDAMNPERGFNLTLGGKYLRGGESPIARPVSIFDCETGVKIADFESRIEAQEYVGHSVCGCLSGSAKTVGNYICRYSDEVDGISVLPLKERHRHRAQPQKEKPVNQYDLDGNYIHTFPSVDAAEKALCLSRGVVANAARGASKSGGGFQWSYYYSSETVGRWIPGSETRRAQGSYHGKPIDQINLSTGEVINTFSSTHEAERMTGIRRGNIFMVLSEKYTAQSAGGYGWRYHTE